MDYAGTKTSEGYDELAAARRAAYRRRLQQLRRQQQQLLLQQQQEGLTTGFSTSGPTAGLTGLSGYGQQQQQQSVATRKSTSKSADADYDEFLYNNLNDEGGSSSIDTSGFGLTAFPTATAAAAGSSSEDDDATLRQQQQLRLRQRQQQQQLLLARRRRLLRGDSASSYDSPGLTFMGLGSSPCTSGWNAVLIVLSLAAAAVGAYFIVVRANDGTKKKRSGGKFSLEDMSEIGRIVFIGRFMMEDCRRRYLNDQDYEKSFGCGKNSRSIGF